MTERPTEQTQASGRPSLAERFQERVEAVRTPSLNGRADETAVRAAVPEAPASQAPAQASAQASVTQAPAAPSQQDGPDLPPPAADQASPQPKKRAATKRSGRASKPRRPPRRARLRLTRIDPWSVMKTAFLLSIALGVVTIVSVLMVWSVLGAAGVWDSINSTVRDIVGEQSKNPFTIQDYLGTDRVIGFTMLVAVIDVVLLTAIATLGAFLYNMAAALLGGIDITLVEDER